MTWIFLIMPLTERKKKSKSKLLMILLKKIERMKKHCSLCVTHYFSFMCTGNGRDYRSISY